MHSYSCFWNIFYLGHDFLFLEKNTVWFYRGIFHQGCDVEFTISVLIRSHMFWFYSDSSWHFNGTTWNDFERLFFGSPDVFCHGFLASRGFCQVPEPAAKSASKKPSAETSKKACSQGWLVQFDFIEGSFIRAVMLNLSILIRLDSFRYVLIL